MIVLFRCIFWNL